MATKNDNGEMPTWDVTYDGKPLGLDAWNRHLDLLRMYAEGPQQNLRFTAREFDDLASWQAKIAIAPLLREYLVGQWYESTLTEYGKIYARQRGIAVK